MRHDKIFRILPILIACLLTHVCALAGVRLEAPARAARGDAFLALAAADQPATCFTFHWRGKSYKAVAQRAADAGGQWQAVILLPVPLDEKAQRLELAVTSGREGPGSRASDDVAKANMAIALYDRERPVQKLTVDKKYVNPPAAQQERIKKDREKVRRILSVYLPERYWTLPFERPVPGGVSSLFGMKRVFNGQPRSVHRGLDLRGAQGTPIRACADGEVALADNLYFSGNAVYINHGEGVFSAYLHMSESKVKAGERVRKGQVVGLVGATGRVTGPHLHLSLIVQGQSVDPQPFLAAPAAGAKPGAAAISSGNAR
ncbi:M23 family metallopeptidase [Desulfovibrio sp. ZJ369]|uniref:M23 family metallopeptidase n=1 Tax=Desulfovibrio sp. ZJ369 TaxID=2709793 RepID=UPI0013ECB163|nr:M23 family metallopeptidase [Desulfovibrio sp. ZJ369]